MSSSLIPFKLPARSPPPLPRASTPNSTSHQKPKRGRSNTKQSSSHAKKPSIGQVSVATSCRSADSAGSKTLWDKEDTFLPRAKPPPPLPKLDKHKRMKSQRHIQPSLDTQSTSTDSSFDFPVLDISRRHQLDDLSRPQSPLSRSNTQITASSGTSEESLSNQWRPPPSWAGPDACVEEEEKPPKPARSLSRFGSRRRAQSHTRTEVLMKPEAIRLVDIVGSGDRAGSCDLPIYPSSDVKIQYYEGWHEKPVEDVIHMLRELRLK